jgi:hypothetical protein
MTTEREQGLVWSALTPDDETLYALRVGYIRTLIERQRRTDYAPALCDKIEYLIERAVSCSLPATPTQS